LWKGRGRIKGKEGREKGRGEMGVVARRGKGNAGRIVRKYNILALWRCPVPCIF